MLALSQNWLSKKVLVPLVLALIVAGVLLATTLTYLYQKIAGPSWSGIARASTSSGSCTLSAEEPTNERKQLFVNCAGFLD